jgi:hypothetical protein
MEMHGVMTPVGPLVIADVVSAEDPHKVALHNAIEKLRDPSHVRMLTELIALMTSLAFPSRDRIPGTGRVGLRSGSASSPIPNASLHSGLSSMLRQRLARMLE